MINLFRGMAILIIVSIHAPIPVNQIHAPLGILLTSIGHVAIKLFFFISGYVLGKGFLLNKYKLTAKGILGFYLKRTVRIIPLYYAVVIFLFLQTQKTDPQTLPDLLGLLFFYSSPKTSVYSAGYLWFVSTIMQLYLLSPLFFFILGKIRNYQIFARLLVFISVFSLSSYLKWQLSPLVSYDDLSSLWIFNTDIFFSGMLLSSFNSEFIYLIKSFKKTALTGFILLTAISGYLYIYYGKLIINLTGLELQKPYLIILFPFLALFYVALVLSIFPEKNSRLYPFFFLSIIGKYSYEIYLLHQPLLSKLNLTCPENCTLTVFSANVLMIIIFSLAIILLINKLRFVKIKNAA